MLIQWQLKVRISSKFTKKVVYTSYAYSRKRWFILPTPLLGRGDEVRVCEYTNSCEGLDQKHKQVTCKLWDRTGLDEEGVSLSRDGRRRLVAPRWKP